MRRLVLSPAAGNDLVEICSYIAADSPAHADRFLERLHEKCARLAESPGMGAPRPEIAESLRSFPLGNYVIFYRSNPNAVEIARVLIRIPENNGAP
jgi:plasmid stabilization system protein ParE